MKAKSSIKLNSTDLTKGSKINYIPLFSPSPSLHYHARRDFNSEEYGSDFSDFEDNDSSDFLLYRTSVTPVRRIRFHSDSMLNECHTISPIESRKLKDFLVTPMAHRRKKERGPTPNGRVLTSHDNLMLLEELEKKEKRCREVEGGTKKS